MRGLKSWAMAWPVAASVVTAAIRPASAKGIRMFISLGCSEGSMHPAQRGQDDLRKNHEKHGKQHIDHQERVRALDHGLHAQPAHAGHHVLHRSEEHTSELQSRLHLVCRLLLEKKKK